MSRWSRPAHEAARIGSRDLPPPPGVTLVPGGADVAVYAGHADGVDLCLFEPGDTAGATERRIPLSENAHGWWFAFVPGMGPGQRYGLRVHGEWDPHNGNRHNPAQLLLDPYARAIEGDVRWGGEIYGHVTQGPRWKGDGLELSPTDSAAFMPRCVVVDDTFDWGDDRHPQRSRSETVIYEAHVRSMTMLHPDVPEELRGTYAGMAHPAILEHLTSLGVTAVELLPIHASTHEPHLVHRELTNHWGYNTIGFFAPHAPYAAATDPQGVVDEVKGMVKELHAAGIEVLLDVVYNHSAEQSGVGATLSFRGLDNRAYYRLDERGNDLDVTGCGNTFDLAHPIVCRLALDSLRHWVNEYHVDGFRFDLAVALGRGRNDQYDPDHPFLVGVRADPLLSQVKLIVEPWDLGLHGWRTGQFPPPFSEWNDRYRDTVRSFWLKDRSRLANGGQGHGVQDLATRLSGSRDLFGRRNRGPIASVNFVTAHDGFTLHDLTAYDIKHNLANREDNRDGTDHNLSWNHGVEGPTTDKGILAARRRTMRSLLGTLLMSTGIPMINGGDELGRSQGGNNNPYCQDNEISWIGWDLEPWQEDLLATARFLVGLRSRLPAVRRASWTLGHAVADDGSLDLDWFGVDGETMVERWSHEPAQTLQMLVNGAALGSQSVLLILHQGLTDVEVQLPSPPGLTAYELLWDSTWDRPHDSGPKMAPCPVQVAAGSMQIYAAVDPT